MTTNTENILATVLGTDATITDEQRSRVLCILKGEEDPSHKPGVGKLYTRKEAAAILRKTPQCVDYYCRKKWLRKQVLGGQLRASGILEEDLIAFMKGDRTAVQK